DLQNPEKSYELDNGIRVQMDQYFPDYIIEDGELVTETKYSRYLAFVFSVYLLDTDEVAFSFLGIGKYIDPIGMNEYVLNMNNMFETLYVSVMTVRRDYTLPLFFIGATIFMIGVIQGMYWQHRRVWLNPKDGNLLVAAHTNKNWFGIKKDIEKALEGTNITMVEDQEELDEK